MAQSKSFLMASRRVPKRYGHDTPVKRRADVSEREVAKMEEKLYEKLYIGHIPEWWWKNLATYVCNYGKQQFVDGHSTGVETGMDRHWE